MELFLPIERVLWIAYTVAETLVILRFLQLRLWRKYPFFLAFLTVELLSALVLMQFDVRSREYARIYPAVVAILLFFRFGLAVELYQRICDHFPGMGAFRTGMAVVLVLLAGLFAVLVVRPSFTGWRQFPVNTVFEIERIQHEVFAGVFLLTWIFLQFVLSNRQPFRPNVLTHWTIATVYFVGAGAGYLVSDLSSGFATAYPISSAIFAIQLGCLVAWFFRMRRSGEQMPQFARLSPDQVAAVENYHQELLGTVSSPCLNCVF